MTKKVHCEKKTKIYIPKTVNPQIISYHPVTISAELTDRQSDIPVQSFEKRR